MKIRLVCLAILTLVSATCIGQGLVQKGLASFYADKFEGRSTASGEKYKHSKLTAAHKTLPFGTLVRVKNLQNDLSVEVIINDRGPFVEGRIIDLSMSAAERIGMINDGLAEVEIIVVDPGDGKGNNYTTSGNVGFDSEGDESEVYGLTVIRMTSSGYGVQIGSFQEMANLVRLASNLKSSYRKNVAVEVSQVNGMKYYKIIVGNEKTHEKAEKLQDRLSQRFPDCFVINFAEIR